MIRFENAGKAFKSRKDKNELIWPLRHFTATIRKGESTGILVPPGGGKTTLIELVAGSETLTEGDILRSGHISWPVSNRSMFHGKMTGRQNLRFLTDCYGRDFKEAHDFLMDFSDLGRFIDLPLKQYSGEQRYRLAMGAILAMGFEFILVDDVFEAGDTDFRRKTYQYVMDNRENFTFLIATGNPRLVDRYCQRAGVLSGGTVVFHDSVDEAMKAFEELTGIAA
jgi:capsular polysaccharide transport system ATP-binding protein